MTNILAVLRLVLCAIRHPGELEIRYEAPRCGRCNPIRHVAKPKPEAPLFTETVSE
jgi:hypothetical protein